MIDINGYIFVTQHISFEPGHNHNIAEYLDVTCPECGEQLEGDYNPHTFPYVEIPCDNCENAWDVMGISGFELGYTQEPCTTITHTLEAVIAASLNAKLLDIVFARYTIFGDSTLTPEKIKMLLKDISTKFSYSIGTTPSNTKSNAKLAPLTITETMIDHVKEIIENNTTYSQLIKTHKDKINNLFYKNTHIKLEFATRLAVTCHNVANNRGVLDLGKLSMSIPENIMSNLFPKHKKEPLAPIKSLPLPQGACKSCGSTYNGATCGLCGGTA